MKSHKKLKSFISLLCAVSLLFSVCSIPTFAVTAHAVTATTNTTVKQGNTAYCYVYIDSTELLAALDVTVHFDNTKVKINNVYNKVSCTLYDSVKNTSNIQFSYIFDGEGSATKTQLFYFSYQVLSGAEVGDAYFDITIGEAYDNSLNDVAISGSRCSFTIAETVTSKSCSIYASSVVLTSVTETFSLSYRFSTYQIASGSAVITYDPELFEVVEVSNGNFLNGKVTDINTQLAGSIYIAFVGTVYSSNTNFVTVKFKTLKNVSETSKISLKVTELYDLELNPISCSGYTTTASVGYDESYVGDAARMAVSAVYNEGTQQVTAVINLEEKSLLGAGDFVLAFDPAVLNLSSYAKGFEPDFFNINDKQVAEGILKFSIISLEDIVEAETVLTLVFDATPTCAEQNATFDISGSVLTDSLTNSILLNFVNGNVSIPGKHSYSGDCDTTCNLCGEARNEDYVETLGHVLSEDGNCTVCGELYTVPVWIGGIQITASNMADILGDADEGATAQYDAATNTLSFNGFSYEGSDTAIRSKIPLNIVILGENTVDCDCYESILFNIYDGTVTISGTGTLHLNSYENGILLNAQKTAGLIVGGSITIDIGAYDGGIYLNGDALDLLIKENAKVINRGGIFVYGHTSSTVTITDNADVNVTKGGMIAWSEEEVGAITLDGVTITAPEGATIGNWTSEDGYSYTAILNPDGSLADSFIICSDCEDVECTITQKGRTLSYEDLIYVIDIFELIGVEDIDLSKDAGLLIWSVEEFEALSEIAFDADHANVGLTPYKETGYFCGSSDGIFTRDLHEEAYYVGYVKLADGSYIYSEPKLYSPAIYAHTMLSKETTSAETKELCVALLNYISAAQVYFHGTPEEELVNYALTDEQKTLVWNDEITFNLAPEIPADKQVERDQEVFTGTGKNLLFEEMISIVSIFRIDDSIVADAQESGTIFWTAEQFAALDGVPGIDNIGAGARVELSQYRGNAGQWSSLAPEVAAKDMADTQYYYLGYVIHADGSVSYSGVISYTVEQYIYNKVNDTDTSDTMLAFAQWLYHYERAAKLAIG